MNCPACGTANPANARFCLSCGQQLVARNDERRVATVLFADLVGFTGLAETRDPEHVKRLVDDCFEALVGDITAFGGRVDKIVGDAIVALFGAPVAHEDDAERAVRAALRMQESIRRHAEESAATGLAMRIGVNTGEVLVGALRAGGDYTAMGDVVNSAQRLQSAAEPGTVLVGSATFGATQEAIDYQPVEPVNAKGREEPLDAWIAVEPLLPPGYRRRRVQTPFVGRDTELGVMRHAVDTAVERSRAHFLLVLGEAGVGKSRLAEETAKLARMRHHALVFEGRCVPYGEANVWWPVAEALRQACGIEGDAPIGEADRRAAAAVAAALEQPERSPEVKRVVNGLLFLMGYPVALRDIEPQRAREEATRSVLTFVEASTRRRPVVIVLSDLHWADAALLGMVDELIDQLARSPFVLVASARHELLERWSVPTGRHNMVVTHLDPLDRAATRELLTALAEGTELDGAALDALLDRSGGNPFFLEELVALGGAPALPVGDLPDTLRGLVAARIDALTPAQRAVLEDAAVWGRSGPREALDRMGTQIHGAVPVEEVLLGLIDHDILVLDGDRWRFRSDLVREVAYNTLTKADRARRHTGIANFLEHTVPPGEPPSDRLAAVVAHHYATAATLVGELGPIDGVPTTVRRHALEWLQEAAHRAERAQTFPVAVQLYTQALDLAPVGDDPLTARLLLGRAAAATEQRHLDVAYDDIERAMSMAAALDDAALGARALLVLGDFEQKGGDLEAARSTLLEATATFAAVGDQQGRADALRLLGLTHLFLGENQEAEEAILAARQAYGEVQDHRGEAWALQNLAWLSYLRGRASEAEERIDAAVEMFQQLGDSGGLSWSLGLLAFVKLHEGRHGDAEELGKQVLVEARQRGDRWGEGMMLLLMSLVRLWSGRVESAIGASQDALAIFRALGDRFGEVQSNAVLARAEVMVGHTAEGLRRLTEAHDAYASAPHHDELKHFLATVLASTAVQLGLPDLALKALAAGPDPGAEEEPGAIGSVDRRVARGLAHLQLGRIDIALEELLLAVDEEQAHAGGPSSAWAQGALAMALVTAGRLDEAEATALEAAASSRATYLDRSLAHLSLLFVAHQRGRAIDGPMAAIHAEVAAHDDRLLAGITAIARSVLVGGDVDAELALLGIDGDGWRTLFAAAAGDGQAVGSGTTRR